MSLPQHISSAIPEDTVRLARTICPKGTLYMQIRDQFETLYDDESFAALFSTRGQPAEAPWRLALVCVFQFIEGLTDRQTAEAVQQRIDWKYALALELTDPGFDFSVLSKFRSRVVEGGAERQFFEVLLTHLKTRGLLKARGRQRTDSTHVLAAVRVLNRLERVGETLRQALNRLAQEAPDWLRTQAEPAWYERYGRRMDNYRFPKAETERQALGATMGEDGFALLGALDAAATPPWLRDLPAVQTLRRVWAEQYIAPPGPVRFRDKQDLGPSADLIASPYDTEARYSSKRGMEWLGYKVHFTESCDANQPRLLTHVATTPATLQDEQVLPQIYADLAAWELLPTVHVVDAGYTDAEGLVRSQRDYGVTLLGPVAEDPSWQARAGEGFDKASFVVDWEAHAVRCPAGKLNYSWLPQTDLTKSVVNGVRVQFASRDCLPCAFRAQCTRRTKGPRELILQRREAHEALAAAKQRQTTAAYREQYAWRAGIEATNAQGTQRCDLRRSRYIGLARTRLQHFLTATALNLVRTVEWLAGDRPGQTRRSHFAALEPLPV
jgi:transposase